MSHAPSYVSRSRIVVDRVAPSVDGGRFAAKAIVGESFEVTATLVCDGHEELSGNLAYRAEGERSWTLVPLAPLGNDLWRASFTPKQLGRYVYTVEAWLNPFEKWKHDASAKLEAGVLGEVDAAQAILLIQSWAEHVRIEDWIYLQGKLQALELLKTRRDREHLDPLTGDARLGAIAREVRHSGFVRHGVELGLQVEPRLARTGAWYELFPRSFGGLRASEKMLDYVADLGFDVVYLPPVHPIGVTCRKGKNGGLEAGPDDVGSPWAIGAREGGHCSIDPRLGTMRDFEHLVGRARELGLEVALDIAFQCSPDHPYVREHPGWFRRRADGTIQYAENPPKRYEDIYPFDFEGEEREALWQELRRIFVFWRRKGVTVFRVDNPHTKPLHFWEWLIADLKREYPELIFLAEAFTRPNLMKYLAKAGFSQSYTYFAWRTTKQELTEYLRELNEPGLASYFRPSFWPNTPDILSGPLRGGRRADFEIRLFLASTLSPTYGIYGPAFELCENRPRDAGSEEYLDSEKYELRAWDLSLPVSLAPAIRRLNRLRRSERPLQGAAQLRFHPTTSERLLAYSLSHGEAGYATLCVVNLDSGSRQAGQLEYPLSALGWKDGEPVAVRDLLSEASYAWQGSSHYIELDPARACAHLFRVPRP